MKNIALGKNEAGKRVSLDLSKLVEGRGLVNGNSGAGKSDTLRLIIEQAHKDIQVIVVDPEDEFITLREVMPNLLIVGDGGETPAQIKTAPLLARKVVEHRISTVLALNSLEPDARQEYLKAFIAAMMALPKKYWHPILVVIDEAHSFCPQKRGVASKEAVITLMAQGRKRGFTGVLATQRLSKLDKDSFETNNIWMGRVWQPADQKASAEILGIDKAEAQAMRLMQPGEFYTIGPAFNIEGKTQMNRSATTKPAAGKEYLPPSSTSIKDVVAMLGDIPAEVQAQDDLLARLQGENLQLKRDLAAAKSARPAATEPKVITERVEVRVFNKELGDRVLQFAQQIQSMSADLNKKAEAIAVDLATEKAKPLPPLNYTSTQPLSLAVAGASRTQAWRPVTEARKSIPPGLAPLPPGEKAILTALLQFPDGLQREQLSVLTGYKRSSRDAYIKRLAAKDLITTSGSGQVQAKPGADSLLPEAQPLPTGRELRDYWLARLPEGERAVLTVLIQEWPAAISRDLIDEATPYKRSSRDAYLKRLAAKKLVEFPGAGKVVASRNLFDL